MGVFGAEARGFTRLVSFKSFGQKKEMVAKTGVEARCLNIPRVKKKLHAIASSDLRK